MAEMALQVVVSPLLGVVFDKLSSPLLTEFGSLWGLQKDLKKLSESTSTIKDVLQDAEQKQIHDVTTKNWLRKLKEATYEADDVIEECIAGDLFTRASEVHNGSCSAQVCDSFPNCFNFRRFKLRHKIAKRVKEIREKFDEIVAERSKFHLNERALEREPVENSAHYRETGSVVLEKFVYGRDMVKEKIIGILLNNASSEDNLLVYSIIGMGGLGKTTLAQCVYKDTCIEKNFHFRIWVCVSEVFSAKKIIKAIIESVSGEKCKLENLDALESRLKDLLTGKKFLLVLDDEWNEDRSNWAQIKFPLSCGAKGSSIIVTTRSVNVAQIMGVLPMNQHKLAPLSDEECWSLFKGMAFEGEVIENSELERIGRIIVKKCGGVPLAAKALGGALQSEREVNVWKSISTSEIWKLREDGLDGGIIASLNLSYNRLPGDKKQCFSYCSIFPKDHRINIAELIQLWIANGLVQYKRTLDLEDEGRRTFDTLLQKSFFQEVEIDSDGRRTCKMHDLMHDLACDAAKNECIHFNGSDQAEIPNRIRHLSTFGYSSNSNILRSLHKSHPFLRTLIGARNIYFKQENILFKSLRCLRVLDLSDAGIEVIPASIGKMKHLRYLDLSDNRELVCLPSSLCDLKTLLTLKLRWCSKLKQLPKKMSNLVNLVHLDLYGTSLTQMPPGIGKLVRLRSLTRFVVGGGNGQSIKELGNLDKLGGYLSISGLGHVKDATEARVANLAAKSNLINLSLTWAGPSVQQGNEEEEVFKALQPHPDLSGELQIFGYRGSRFPSWMQNLEKLREIFLLSCSKCEDLPPLGHLPLLKKLYISWMDSLKRINKEFYGTSSSIFPSLEFFRIGGLPNLEEWEALDVDDTHLLFPKLQRLVVSDCPNLALLPCSLVSSLQNLLVRGSLTSLSQSLQHLSSLESLSIYECNQLEFSSSDFQHLLALQTLQLSKLPKLISLPDLPHLPTLQTLKISYCRNLKVTPHSFQNLTSLQTLKIEKCEPDLESKCKKDTGEYWQ